MVSPIEYPLRILYVTVDDAESRRGAINNGYYIGRALQSAGADIHFFGHARLPLGLRLKYMAPRLISKMLGCSRPLITERSVMEFVQQRIISTMKRTATDIVFANSVQAIMGLQGRARYCFMTDAPAVGLLDMGHYFDHWCNRALSRYIELDREISRGAELIFYHSEWAAKSAISAYSLDPERVFVVNPGANIEHVQFVPSDLTSLRASNDYQFLFYGRDWHRKGGPLALKIVEQLLERSLNCRLVVCGPPRIPEEVERYTFVDYVEPIDKDAADGSKRLAELFLSTDCLLLPTRSEASAGAIREAAAFGVPSVTSDVGGISALIVNEVSGLLLPIEASISDYVDAIEPWLTDDEKWLQLKAGSRDAYEKRLNWDVAGAKMMDTLISKLLSR